MSALIGLIVITFLVLGIVLLILGLRVLQKPAGITPPVAKKSERKEDLDTPNLKAAPINAAPPSNRVSPKHETIPTANQDVRGEVKQVLQKNTLLWAGTQTPLTMHEHTIESPLTYWSHGSESPDEASCLNIQLPLGQPHNPNTPPLPYWPRYSQITPDQRSKYLLWLSTGKDNDLEEIGYAFLYFYGLERRALIDKKDLDLIVPEVQRLLNRYRFSGSFNTYLNDFLAYVVAVRLETLSEDDLKKYFQDMANLTESMTMVALAWYAQKGKNLPWQLAYSAARHFSGTAIPSAAKKEISYLEKLFQTRYLSTFAGGLSLVPAKNPYRLAYKPASPSILVSTYDTSSRTTPAVVPHFIPNPLRRKKQFGNLFSIWESCIQDIKPFLTQLSKGKGTITWQAYAALPEELKSTIPHPNQDSWDRLFEENRQGKPWAFVTTSSIAEVIGIEKRNRLTVAQSRNLAKTVHDGGYVFLPDIRHAGNSYLWDETLALLSLPADGKEDLSLPFPSYALTLELGIGIAASDGHIDSSERTYLRTFFEEILHSPILKKQCLEALEDLYTQKPPSLIRLGKRLREGLDPDTRLSVAQYLVGVAAADGTIDSKEKRNLNRIFKAMEIEEGYLNWLLARAEKIDPFDAPVVVHSGMGHTGGENLPVPETEIAPTFSIDKAAVARIMGETRAASQLLSEVFTKEETSPRDFILESEGEPEAVQVQVTPSSDYYNMEELSPRYMPVFEELLSAEIWTKDEFNDLIQCHNCMPQRRSSINVWVRQNWRFSPLEDENGSVRVYHDLIELGTGG